MKVDIPHGETRVIELTCNDEGHEFEYEWGETNWEGYVNCPEEDCDGQAYVVVSNREPPKENHPGW